MNRHANAAAFHPVRVAREKLGLSREGLAFKAGLSLRAVERIEAGQTQPRRATLRVLAEVLGTEAADLRPVERKPPTKAAA